MIFFFELSSPEAQASDVLEHILDRISSLSLNSPREELLRKFDETPTEETSIAKRGRLFLNFSFKNQLAGSRLPYSVSFHRKTMRERNKDYLERERDSELTLTPTHSLSSLSISTANVRPFGSMRKLYLIEKIRIQ